MGRLRGLAGGGSPGPYPGGCWGSGQGGPGPGGGESQHALRQKPTQQTATAADGTHPTGMHSCYLSLHRNKLRYMHQFQVLLSFVF